MTTTTRKAKSYSDQNKKLNIPEDTWFQNFLNKYAPTLRSQYEVEKGLIAKQKGGWESMQSGLDLDGISDKISGMSYKGSSADLDSQHEGLLLGEEDSDSIIVKSMEDELSYDKQDMQDISYTVDDDGSLAGFGDIMDDKESYAESAVGRDSEVSGGMTDNVFGSDDPQMSPQMQKYALGLLKDYMEPDSDPAPQPVRGMGIIKGGGTPFPSLLQKKPERQRHVNKGLGLI
jgi:hypothetical protein|tara:strand:- start:31614 stop:32306 length:693 start_codon:yes stop_codon:yes gene_type:complete